MKRTQKVWMMKVSKKVVMIEILLEREQAEKLRNILGDSKVREIYGFEFAMELSEELNEVLRARWIGGLDGSCKGSL